METSNSDFPDSIGVIGYGTMGQHYVRNMMEMGVDPKSLIVHDMDDAKLAKCKQAYPDIQVIPVLAAAKFSMQAAFVLTNTPNHLSMMKKLAGHVPYIMTEKPVVLANQLEEYRQIQTNSTIVTGYLINFSQAVQALIEQMNEYDLSVVEGRGGWGKDRTADTRPTAGDLEDEMTHPLGVLEYLVEQGQQIKSADISAAFSRLPFVNAEKQAAMHAADESYDLEPIATSALVMRLRTDLRERILLTMQSSFVSQRQHRWIEASLGTHDRPLVSAARIDFDEGGKDKLTISPYGSKVEPTTLEFPAQTKLPDQIGAFLRFASGQRMDPRLRTVQESARLVEISQKAIESDAKGRSVQIEY